VPVQADKKEARPVGMHSAQQSARVYVPEDVPHGGEGQVYIRGIVHGKEKARQQLNGKHKPEEAPEISSHAKVDRRGEVNQYTIDQLKERILIRNDMLKFIYF